MKNPIKKIILILIPLFAMWVIYLSIMERSPKNIPNAWLIKNGTWPILNSVFLTYDKDIITKSDHGELSDALKLTLKKFDENKQKDLWDYDQLMWIYIDMWKYDKVIELWEKAVALLEKTSKSNATINKNIIWNILQAYLYTWELQKAEYLMKKHNNIDFIFEKNILEYKKWNYDYLINNHNKILEDNPVYIWFDLDLMAKSYIKKWDLGNAIKIQEEIFSYWNRILAEDIMKDWKILEQKNIIVWIFYLHMSTSSLKDLYLETWDKIKSDFYGSKFLYFKNKIDNEEVIDGVKLNKEIMYFGINRIKNDL